MDTEPTSLLTSEDERLLLRLIYFPDEPPTDVDRAVEQRLTSTGLVRRDSQRLVVTGEGMRYFTFPHGKAA